MRPGRRGFTLLELLIVGTLGTLVLVFITNAWLWYGRSTNQMHVAAQLTRELKFAALAIAHDFGPALEVRSTTGQNLQFDYDLDGDDFADWAAPDAVIEYVVSGGKLLRRDLSLGSEIAVAGAIDAIEVEMVNGIMNIMLSATHRATTQELTLQLRDPS